MACGSRVDELQDVGDVNVFALVAHRLNDLRQQLPRATDERFALRVFVGSRRFTDEHQLGARVADAEDDVVAAPDQLREFMQALARASMRASSPIGVEAAVPAALRKRRQAIQPP